MLALLEVYARLVPRPRKARKAPAPKAPAATCAECVVCMTKSAAIAFVPCGHMCTCRECSRVVHARGHCPVCRQRVRAMLEVVTFFL